MRRPLFSHPASHLKILWGSAPCPPQPSPRVLPTTGSSSPVLALRHLLAIFFSSVFCSLFPKFRASSCHVSGRAISPSSWPRLRAAEERCPERSRGVRAPHTRPLACSWSQRPARHRRVTPLSLSPAVSSRQAARTTVGPWGDRREAKVILPLAPQVLQDSIPFPLRRPRGAILGACWVQGHGHPLGNKTHPSAGK